MSGFSYIPDPADGAAWVTGASSGIGRALTLRLAAQGWTVYATARSSEKLAELAAQSPRIRPMPGDVTDLERMREIVTAITDQHPLALSVLNAGIYTPMRAQEFDAAEAGRMFAVNQGGVANCLEPLLPHLLARGTGCVAITASVAGYRGLPRAAPYSGTKAALIAMAEALAFDLAPRGVRICVINPGFVETEATGVNDFEMPFLMQPDEVAQRITSGLARPGFEIAFPLRFVLILKALRLLRPRSYFWLVRKAIGWDDVEAPQR
ncbi:MAG: SDR family NAD(P)-dependent oxidoreductase [Neomegalonema sp.]|nr:SDR family NAD(P)-dependent oxidoreductase [Neomegalonema sp.]